MKKRYTPNLAILIKPINFSYNEETSETNTFQVKDKVKGNIINKVNSEFNNLVKTLIDNKVAVTIFSEIEQDIIAPDTVYSNNWITYFPHLKAYTMPMYNDNRRIEVNSKYILGEYSDYIQHRSNDEALEGTGSMVIDHESKIIYAGISKRTNINTLNDFAKKVEYDVVSFNTLDSNNNEIYHTNIMMAIGETWAVLCKDVVVDSKELISSLERTGKKIIYISESQINNFCGNIFEMRNSEDELVTFCSLRAFNNFSDEQRKELNRHTILASSDIDTIETIGGGSVRCMITGKFTDFSK